MPAPRITRSPVHTAVVLTNDALTPRMRRVTIRAEELRGVTIRPAQDLELHLQESTGRRVKRRYTIRNARPAVAEFDLDVALHGPARARTGARVSGQATPSRSKARAASWNYGQPAWHLLAGDESALPAIAAICEALPAAEQAFAVVEVADPAEQLPLRRPPRLAGCTATGTRPGRRICCGSPSPAWSCRRAQDAAT